MTSQYTLSKLISYISFSIICGELYFLLLRQNDITKVFKKKPQRTEEENKQIQHGLRLSLFLEAILFAPVSIILFCIIIFPFFYSYLIQINPDVRLWYGAMGIVGYNFPFVALRKAFTKIAIVNIKNVVADVASNDTRD